MTVSERVAAALRADDTASDGLRVFPNKRPLYPHYPLITYSIIAGEDDVHLDGRSNSAQRLVQLDAWGRTEIGVAELMEIAIDKMLAASSFSVGRISLSGADPYEPETDLYRSSYEFSIAFEQ